MPTVSQFLIDRIQKLDVDTIFGVPGDYVLNLYHQFNDKFRVINTIDEQGAGFAADAYARTRPGKLGVVVATYCVGGLKLANAIACAYAEKSPVLFISGAPGLAEQKSGIKLHHMVGSFQTQHDVFRHLTKTTAVITDPTQAGSQIDNVLESIKAYSMPAYIEIPRDLVDKPIKYDVFSQGNPLTLKSEKETLNEAINRTLEMITSSKKPVILAGVEIARFDFGKRLIRFAEKHNIPVATTILAKSVIDETHELSLGIYCGQSSKDFVRDYVETSDCVIQLGVFQTDMNLGFQAPRTAKSNEIFCSTAATKVKLSTYDKVFFCDFMNQLLDCDLPAKQKPIISKGIVKEFISSSNRKIEVSRLFEKINTILDKNMAIIADIGDSLFGSIDLNVHYRNQFLASAYYTTMGFSVPAAIGVCASNSNIRPIVICGDGAFQMTGMEVSTLAKNGMNPIIFVLNNGGFLTERYLGHDGEFNDILPWKYHKIPDVIGCGKGFLVQTEGELEVAIKESLNNPEFSIIDVVLDKMDATIGLKRMMESLRKKV